MDNEQKQSFSNDENLTENIFTGRIKSQNSKLYTGKVRNLNTYYDSSSNADYDVYEKDGNNYIYEEDKYYSGSKSVRDRRSRRLVKKQEKNRTKEILGWVLSIGVAICAAFLIRAFIFEIILVDGESMVPTLHTDERVAVEKLTRYGGLPERGDIIIVKYPNMDGTFVKRAIGLPGDTVEIKNSTVYINGEPLEETYTSQEPYADMEAITVPEDQVFVMGDNRAHSLDSRADYIGSIPRESIVGHGLFVIWPFSEMHSIQN